jgi:DNA repair protein RadD
LYTLRPYQQEAVDSVIKFFQTRRDPAVLVLPTGAGKSLVIAEIARIAKGDVLVLAHVKELVEQNHEKYETYGTKAGIYSAGLNRKDENHKVTFGSIQSVARASESFFKKFSILVVDECHRISLDEDSQYLQVIKKLQNINPSICVLGLTATPYRLGMGWIYEFNHKGFLCSEEKRFFKKCLYDLPLSYMIENNFLTMPIKIDAPVACYDFSDLKLKGEHGKYSVSEIKEVLSDQKRVTPGIIGHIVNMAKDRQGVMIFTSTVDHAKEILELLPEGLSELVIGDTELAERDEIIRRFKAKEIKFLVNVSVLTTGFDAPHVDLIALLRPTESVSLFQQIVGRGLRLSPGKDDCLILDYTGSIHDLFSPEIGEARPSSESVEVLVDCPDCGFENHFWGLVDSENNVTEHYGRKCKGAQENLRTHDVEPCGYRFRFKICDQCGGENDISARVCNACKHVIIDVDDKLKAAMELKDAHVMRPDTMFFEKTVDKKKRERLQVSYYDLDGEALREYYYFNTTPQIKAFYYNFTRMHNRLPGIEVNVNSIDDALINREHFRTPMFVIARKNKYYWEIREKIFNR